MSTFKTSLKIAFAHRIHAAIYLVVLSMLGLFTALPSMNTGAADLKTTDVTVAVIDRDQSPISQNLRSHVESVGTVRPLDDSTEAFQNATARGTVQYILIIPQGYGAALEKAATDKAERPQMQTVISYESANGALVDVRTDTWLDQVYDHISVGSSTDKAIELTNEAMDQNSHAEVLHTTDAGLPDALMIFANFSTYPIFAFTVVIIVNLMSALNTSPIRQRLTSSPVTGFSRGLGLLGTTLIIGFIGWAWIFGLGMGVFPPENIPASLPLIGVLALALGAYTLVGVSVGFLMGQLGIRGNGAAAIANVGGMIFSFLAGAWVPLDYMPQSVLTISQLTPGYWAAQAISGASEVSSTSAEAILPLVQNCGIAALFGVAITAVALGVGRNRARASI